MKYSKALFRSAKIPRMWRRRTTVQKARPEDLFRPDRTGPETFSQPEQELQDQVAGHPAHILKSGIMDTEQLWFFSKTDFHICWNFHSVQNASWWLVVYKIFRKHLKKIIYILYCTRGASLTVVLSSCRHCNYKYGPDTVDTSRSDSVWAKLGEPEMSPA